MKISYLFLILAIVLLWLPEFLPKTLPRGGGRHSRGNDRWRVGAAMAYWPNWIAFVRGLAGTYLLVHMAVEVDPKSSQGPLIAAGVFAGVLGIGTVIQTCHFGSVFTVIAPVFYLSAVTLLLPGWVVGAFAVITAWILAVGSKSMNYVLPGMLIALGAAGYVIQGIKLPWLVNLGLLILPFFICLLTAQRFYYVTRGHHKEKGQPNAIPGKAQDQTQHQRLQS